MKLIRKLEGGQDAIFYLWSVFTLSRGTQMTKAMAAMLVSLTKKKLIKILLYGDINTTAMTSSANTS